MSHIKEYCPFGVMVRTCRCPGGEKTIVPCPPSHKCKEKAPVADIHIFGTEYGGIWLMCKSCGTSTQERHAKPGIKADWVIEWVNTHVCVSQN